ncbi:alpha/beta-hydrolase [Amniculicola lignicola CBS 123094]|uniref:Alpha/beta-hydrolase n=1 Tax=Amniculicola lignicola CBS 123094 TaxID=1392246 RepID=A0A6A5X3M2_9PLEO|nr:alpha/beta-hydrolase [Amniculicola lignicola CBS 123094]
MPCLHTHSKAPSPNSPSISISRWRQRIVPITTPSNETIRIHYIDCPAPEAVDFKGTILLIHGFPQTSHQYRHVITPLSDAGYRVVVPDYRGAGRSSKPVAGYEKKQMAEDLHILLTSHLGVKEKIHVVGYDVGGMIAFAYASRYSEGTASVSWGECPLPGTSIYEKVKGSVAVFHFVFHSVPDLPEALIEGKERIYLQHFYDKACYNGAAILPEDVDLYTRAYSQPGAIRAGLNVYRVFEKDAEENAERVKTVGKLNVPSQGIFGAKSPLAAFAEPMLKEVHESFEVLVVEDSGHYVAEENPEGFVRGVLAFVGKIKA